MQSAFREIRDSFYIRANSNPEFPPHLHDDIELIYVRQGGGWAFCDGRRCMLQPGSFFLAFPNQSHAFTQCVNGDYIILNMKSSRLLYHNNIFIDGQPESALYSGKDASLGPLLETVLAEFEEHGYIGRNTVIDGYLTVFFEKLLRGYRIHKSSLAKNCMLDILHYCNQHYREDIGVEDISRELHISRSHISHLFNQRLQINFSSYINSLRLNDAAKLLESSDHSITQIAGLAGFSAVRTFNRAFREQYGMSPTDYRAALQKISQQST